MLPRLHARLITTAAHASPAKSFRYPYFVPRNTRGNLPVYTDVRNGGTRYLVLVRNIDGKPDVCLSIHRIAFFLTALLGSRIRNIPQSLPKRLS
ncbi:hypothetical protein H0H87_012860 [Tephrocybe sp. NHM501043]|nr:hypothetical protein H0H87_012860 [Tephrocybe sp. NHM501043]